MAKEQRFITQALKALRFSAIFGAAFGLFFDAIIWFTDRATPGLALLMPPLGGAFTSGAAGFLGAALDHYLYKRGIQDPGKRRRASFMAVSFVAALATAGIAMFGNLTGMLRQVLFAGSLLGVGLGALIEVNEFRLWSAAQRVATLELENKYLAEIAAKDEQLEETTRSLIVAEERTRMARDLHDSVSQGVHGIIYAVQALKAAVPQGRFDPRVDEIIEHLEGTAEATLSELRAMIMELKPALLEENGLTEALNLHCDLFARRQNVTVNLDIAEHLPLAPEQEVAVYRIVQEALGNVQKHSDADWASVSLRAMNSGETVNLVVRDNGKGFDPGQPGYGNGLMNMRARCREAGGELTVESAPGEGTTIRASFPALGEK